MVADYPAAQPDFTGEVGAPGDPLNAPALDEFAEHVAEEISAITATLGINPQGASATVKARLEALENAPLNVTNYGALGDGTTDDTAAFVAAVAEAGTEHRTVWVPAATFIVSTLALTSGIRLDGDARAVIKQKAATSATLLTVADAADDVTIANITLDGNRANQSANNVGILAQGDRFTLDRVTIRATKWDAVSIKGPATHATVTRCVVSDTGRYGITLTNGDALEPVTESTIAHNHVTTANDGALGIVGIAHDIAFTGNTVDGSGGDGIAAYNAANRRISATGNTIRDTGNHGIHLGGEDLVMAGNVIEDVAQRGLYIENHDVSTARRFAITGNTVRTAAGGYGVYLGFVTHGTVSANSLSAINTHGIFVGTGVAVSITGNVVDTVTLGAGIRLEKCQRCTIGDNQLSNMTASDGIIFRDIATAGSACKYNTIVGNVVHTVAGRPVNIQESSDFNILANNILVGYATALQMVGSNNVNVNNIVSAVA